VNKDLSPVYGYLKNPSMVDYEGHLAAVFFTAGCNFACGFCHNAELMGKPRPGLSWVELGDACRRFRDEWVTAAVISGGEPTLSPTLPALIRFFKDFRWAVKLDTNGSNPGVLRECLPHLDYVAMDIKTAPSQYQQLTGYPHIERLRESVGLIKEQAADYEFRTTIIEDVHSDAHLDEIGELLRASRRYILQPFVPSATLPQRRFRTRPRTSPDCMRGFATRVADCAAEVRVRGL
jgi:pyruvate formate lyase activating enzyme